MKIILLLFILVLSGCVRNLTPEERAERNERRHQQRLAEAQQNVARAEAIVHACDKNGGTFNVEEKFEGSRFRYSVGMQVTCKDGMGKLIP